MSAVAVSRASMGGGLPLYGLLNAAFLLLVALGMVWGHLDAAHPVYLVLLFALCSSAVCGMRQLNDRQVYLLLFSVIYFLFYGLMDVVRLLTGSAGPAAPSGLFDKAELVILAGGVLAHVGYRVVQLAPAAARRGAPGDWSERTLVSVGLLLWTVCTWLSWEFKVHVIVSTAGADIQRGLAGLGGWETSAFILGIMLQPLGLLMLAYAQSRFQRAYLTPLLIAVVVFQFAFGFIVDVKGDALMGAVLVILVKLLTQGRVPRMWLVVIGVSVALAFPVLQANRVVRGESGMDRTAAAQNVVQVLKKAVATSRQASSANFRPESFFERLSLKTSVELIVSRTGKDVAFQDGDTLSPLLTAFIPRLIWPDKPDVQTGRVMNEAFQVSEQAETYISPSHLGELYWNFGWSGALGGMFLIGALLGIIGRCCDLSEAVTLTRVMIAAVTMQALVLGFESTIAAQYVVWMRSMLAIGLLHLVLARRSGAESSEAGDQTGNGSPRPDAMSAAVPFPNLMR